MTPKEKAKELVNKYHNEEIDYFYNDSEEGKCLESGYMTYNSAVDCAIIATEEIIDQWDYVDTYLANLAGEFNPNLRYWQSVKSELENLKNL